MCRGLKIRITNQKVVCLTLSGSTPSCFFFFFFRIFFCHSLNKSFLHLNHEEIIIKRRNAVDYQQAKWFGVILPLRIRVAPEFPTANVKESILKSCVALEYTKAQNGTDGYLVLLVPHILRTLHKL